MKLLFVTPHLSTGGMPQFLLKRIKELQNCLGTSYTGRNDIYFGKLTQAALKANGYENGVTDADIDKICNKEIDTPVVDDDLTNLQQ